MSPDKGVHHAIRVARRVGLPLVVVVKMREPGERVYYEREIRPLLGTGIRMMGELPFGRRVELLRGASALLNPIEWAEPFGLVMAEALACGTPVLAFPHGAATEIVEHGRTGFLCADEDAMVSALRCVEQLDRTRCRSAAETRFSLLRMAQDYERVYGHVLRPSVAPVGGSAGVVDQGRKALRR